MRELERRVANLECGPGGGKGKVLVAHWWEDHETEDDAIRRAGIKPGPADTVVLVRKWGDRPPERTAK